MHSQAIVAYFELGREHKVPLQHTLALICKCRGERLSELAARCGYHRNTLYKALAGELPANPDLVRRVSGELLGINPWEYSSGDVHE